MPRLTLSSPQVVAEVIDGEAIILDLRAGSYFATEGVGAVAWTAVVEGSSSERVVASASAFYGDAPAAGDDVAALLEAMLAAGLLVTSDEAPVEGGDLPWPADYVTPHLERHDDLQDMMQLDPIHDTDATGWPMPAPDHRG